MQTLGDAARALPLYQRALDSRERVLGGASRHARQRDNPGCMHAALGDAAGALPLFRRALDSHSNRQEHPDTLGSVNNLAACMRALGDAAGLPLFRRARQPRRVLGEASRRSPA
jgi:tetratricopeptide (TPR) repeat protein